MAEEITFTKKYKAKDYFNIAQYRSDAWNNLKLAANHFSKNNFELFESEEFKERLEDSFTALKTIEKYFAYPGLRYVESLEELYEVVRSLISESYRTNRSATESEEKRKKMLGDDKVFKPRKQNYFEVILVDELNSEEIPKVKQKFEQLKSENEQFTYDVIILSSVEDALIALLFNPNIQTAIIRSGIRLKSS